MLTEICAEIKNYFSDESDRIIGDFEIVNGTISPAVEMQSGQYYRIVGSVFNDGVHRSDDVLDDETTFHGAVWLMRVPSVILDLDAEITRWCSENASALNSPYTSESFGGYSYSRMTKSDGKGGMSAVGWQDVFASRLKPYRKVRAI